MYRIPLQDLASSDDAQFGLRWEARIPVPIGDIDDNPGLAFHCRYDGLRPGDQVTVCAFDPVNGQWRDNPMARLREVATYRIVRKADRMIEAVKIGETFTVPETAAETAQAAVPTVKLEIHEVGEGAGKSFEVRDAKGNVIEQFGDRPQAEDFMKREAGRGMAGVAGLSVKRAFGGRFQVLDSGGAIIETFTSKADADAYATGGKQKAA